MSRLKVMIGPEEIQKVLPHRYPFLLVDRIIEVEHGKRIVGIKNVSCNEPFFQGHFPGNPELLRSQAPTGAGDLQGQE